MNKNPEASLVTALTTILTAQTTTLCASSDFKYLSDEPPVKLTVQGDGKVRTLETLQRFALKSRTGIEAKELRLREYEGGSTQYPHEVEVLPIDGHKGLMLIVKAFAKVTGLEAYDPQSDGSRDFRSTAFVSGTADKQVVAFRKQSKPEELSTTKFRLFAKKDSVFDVVHEVSFLLDDRIDALYTRGELFIFKKDNFHQLFGFYDGLKEFAKEAMAKIKELVPIANFSDFSDVCSKDISQLKRLRLAMNRIPSFFDMEHVANVIKDEKVPITIIEVEGKQLLEFKASERHAFMTLLMDGFLKSSFSTKCYESLSARPRDVP